MAFDVKSFLREKSQEMDKELSRQRSNTRTLEIVYWRVFKTWRKSLWWGSAEVCAELQSWLKFYFSRLKEKGAKVPFPK